MRHIVLENVTRIYRTRNGAAIAALKNLSLAAEGQGITAVVGPSGCGKTTLLNIVSGLDQQYSGAISADDGVTFDPLRLKFGYLFQTPSLIPWRTVLENVLLGCEINGKVSVLSKQEAQLLLTSYGLGEFGEHYPADLSIGMQQRVALIRLILYGADILLLDEPFHGLDYWMKSELQRNIASFIEQKKTTTILVTHDIEEAMTLADCIYVLSQRPGHVIAKREISIPRSERLKAGPRLMTEMGNTFAEILKDLQSAYSAEAGPA